MNRFYSTCALWALALLKLIVILAIPWYLVLAALNLGSLKAVTGALSYFSLLRKSNRKCTVSQNKAREC
jgi:hypothetical protein